MNIQIPTEQIGSIPRNQNLIDAYKQYKAGEIDYQSLNELAERETIQVIHELEALGSPVISDGEQRKFDGFAHYCLHNSSNFSKEGFDVTFSDGHLRTFAPHLKVPPFRYEQTADSFLEFAKKHAKVPIKQALISPSMLSLVYPPGGLEDYTQAQFTEDLMQQHVAEVRRCLDLGAHKVQLDFTEARLAVKLDSSGELLNSFVDLINKCLSHFSDEEKQRIGIHTCPGADLDSTHSADVDYKYLLPTLFKINAGSFCVAMRGEKNPRKALRLIGSVIRPFQRVFIGVTNPNSRELETPEQVCDLLMMASEFIPVEQLGSTDDCGFSPFADDTSTGRDMVYKKISARIAGTKLAELQFSNR
jgi:5-methyltetrahydropteroyltriglutamate--homocysteine methyltransferase